MRPRRAPRKRSRGFTLIELLTVIAIIVILVAIVIPVFGAAGRATAITGATSLLVDQLNLAREQAVALNRPVEVRFYNVPDPASMADRTTDAYRALQMFRIESNGALIPLGKAVRLPLGIIMAADSQLSNVMLLYEKSYVLGTDPVYPGLDKYKYRAIRFSPNNTVQEVTQTGTIQSAQSRFVTIYEKNRAPSGATSADIANHRVANWSCIQVDAVTGRTKIYRP